MCGRFFIYGLSWEDYRAYLDMINAENIAETRPAFNIAPTQTAAIVRMAEGGEKPELVQATWGLVPRWWKKPLTEKKFSTFNAKSEDVAEKATFRASWKDRPCLVPMSGFYEWQGKAGAKQPYAIGLRNRRVFFTAGLWDRATINGETFDSFTILTTTPNTLMADIHNRMPVIPPQDQITDWLKGSPEIRADMIAPHDPQDMHAWKVGKDVGNVRSQGEELIEPVE